MSMFLGILVLHGIDPGPTLLLENEREIYGLIIASSVFISFFPAFLYLYSKRVWNRKA